MSQFLCTDNSDGFLETKSMKLTIFGITYSIVPEMTSIANKINSLIRDDNTYIFYIASDLHCPNDDDTILFVNIHSKNIYPVFLHVFNEMVEPYFGSVLSSFPFASVIKCDVTDYVICPKREIEAHRGLISSRYGIYLRGSTMYLCPDLSLDFETFSSKHSYSEKEVAEKSIIATKANNKSINTAAMPITTSIGSKAEQKQIEEKPINSIAKMSIGQSISVQAKKLTPDVRKANIRSFCEIDEDSLPLLLSQNKSLCVLNKKTGSVSLIELNSIYSNDLIGVKSEIDIIQLLGKCPIIAQDIKTIKVSDLRHVIKQYEKKKENVIARQMFSVVNGCLCITIPPADAISKGVNIKDCSIDLHRNASSNYENLRSAIKAYNHDTYFIYTTNGFFVAIVESQKKCKIISAETIYNEIPNAKSIGDIMAMFPDKMIVDGSCINIKNAYDVLAISRVPEKAFDICKDKTIIRDRFYGYDQSSKTIIYGDIQL